MNWLKHRRFWEALAVVALALVIWNGGDLLSFGESHPLESPADRVAAILVLIAAWGLLEAIATWRTASANRQLLDGIAGSGSDTGKRSAQEVAELGKRFNEVAAVLKKARFRDANGERRYLHELPWYVFIGAPGSGKTTALVNSGLHFVLGDADGAQSVKGVGGTRNCDWWFTDEAVLLDTAGRYTTQDSEKSVDAAAWNGFLDLLKKFRAHLPLNGVIVTLSVSDLLFSSDAEREQYGVRVRERIRELYDHLGVRLPVYLLVTKADLLAGFMEYFSEFDREARAQVWGVTFADPGDARSPTGIGSVFLGEFVPLERRLYAQLLDRLHQERDLQRRSLIYSFPQQFSSIGGLIAEFLDRAFGAVPGEVWPRLRGVYFTSGTQEGTPIDRVLGTLARAFHLERSILPPAMSSGKSFFLTRLLRDVVFGEAGLAGADESRERRSKRLPYTAAAACVALTIALVAAWAVSFSRNRTFIADLESQAAGLQSKLAALGQSDAELAAAVAALNGLRDLPAGYAARRQSVGGPVAGSMGLGLYQGDQLGDLAVRAYRNALRDVLLPRVAMRIEQRLAGALAPEEVRRSLNAYLMLYGDQRLDPNALDQAASAVIDAAFAGGVNAGLRNDLRGHLKVSLEMRPIEMSRPRDDDLVAAARRRIPGAAGS
jgi:type VI secretion system protein ImpL